MEALLQCDHCHFQFNKTTKQPIILPQCGHTFCLQCIKSMKIQKCFQCHTKQNIDSFDSLLLNEKLINILDLTKTASSSPLNLSAKSGKAQSRRQLTDSYLEHQEDEAEYDGINNRDGAQTHITNAASGKVYCFKHQDKEVEYFCKSCHSIVCPKCMFAEHNGHELAQLEDVTNIIKQNIYDLHTLLLNTKRINEDSRSHVTHVMEEVGTLRDQQIRNIDKGFGELIKKLEEKREELKIELSTRYMVEEKKALDKIQVLDTHTEEIQNIEIIHDELIKFIEKNNDAKVLTKINEISSFIGQSVEDLEGVASCKDFDRSECYVDPALKPLTLNVQKAFEIISKFNMLPAAKNFTKP